MIAWLLSFLSGPLLGKLVEAYKLRLEAGNTRDAKAVELAVAEIQGEVVVRQSANAVIIAEQGRWYTAAPRPLIALAFVIYIWKIVVWDKVLGWGVTDNLTPEFLNMMTIVITAYFGGRTIEKIAQVFKR